MRNADDVAHEVRRYISHVASGFMPDVRTVTSVRHGRLR